MISTMRKSVSFLFGSGFSIPAGLPGVQQLNQRLSKIDESEIWVHSSMIAGWCHGQEDVNKHMSWQPRYFLQDFLEFYNHEVLKDGESFHYETFYDYYWGYLRLGENKEVIENFHIRFGEKYFKTSKKDSDTCSQRMQEFNRIFNQLLASELMNPQHLADVSHSNYPHGDIFGFLQALVGTADVKIHTLNHDLFFESIAAHHSGLFEYFSDGFLLEGSPYYGKLSHTFQTKLYGNIPKSYKVKLSRFVDKFDTALAFFKLHGSIFTSIVYPKDNTKPFIRIKNNYAVSECHEEMFDENGHPYFQFLFDQVHPDFLSGTTNKTRYYTKDPYYIKLLGYFQENLSKADILYVIGYGFQDGGINEYLEKNFLSRGGKMIVISPSKPNSPLIDTYKAIHLGKSVTEVSYDEYRGFLPFELEEPKKESGFSLEQLELLIGKKLT